MKKSVASILTATLIWSQSSLNLWASQEAQNAVEAPVESHVIALAGMLQTDLGGGIILPTSPGALNTNLSLPLINPEKISVLLQRADAIRKNESRVSSSISQPGKLQQVTRQLEQALTKISADDLRSMSDEQLESFARNIFEPIKTDSKSQNYVTSDQKDPGLFLLDYPLARYNKSSQPHGVRFTIPNESTPSDAKKILNLNKGQLYVSVGTERGFIGAALANGISHLLFLDVEPGVVLYNRINTALLQLAQDRNEYRHLRFTATEREWADLARKRPISDENREILSDIENRKFWGEIQSFFSSEGIELRLGGASYLDSDAMFNKLKHMADKQQIRSVNLNLNDANALATLTNSLKQSEVRLGVLDISNAWWAQYMKSENVTTLLEEFNKIAVEKSIFLITDRIGWSMYASVGSPFLWAYFGFHFGDLFSHPNGMRHSVTTLLGRVPKYKHDRLNPVTLPKPLIFRICDFFIEYFSNKPQTSSILNPDS